MLSDEEKGSLELLKHRFDNFRNLGILSALFFACIFLYSKVDYAAMGGANELIKFGVATFFAVFVFCVSLWYVQHTFLVFAPKVNGEMKVVRRVLLGLGVYAYLFAVIIIVAAYLGMQLESHFLK